MRSQNICTKCTGQDLLVVDPWRQPHCGSSNGAVVMRVASFEEKHEGFWGNDWSTDVGEFELWVCASCGYSELYATGTQDLAHLADQGHPGVRRVVVKGDRSEYR